MPHHVVIPSQSADWRGDPPDRCHIVDAKNEGLTNVRGVATPACALVREDRLYSRYAGCRKIHDLPPCFLL